MSFTTNRKQALPFSQWTLPIFFLLEKPPSERVGFTQAPWFPASLSFPLSCLWSGSTIIAAPASCLLRALFRNKLWWGPESPNYLEGNYSSSPLKSLLSLSRRFITGRLLLISLSLWRLKFRYKYSFWESGMAEGDRERDNKEREREKDFLWRGKVRTTFPNREVFVSLEYALDQPPVGKRNSVLQFPVPEWASSPYQVAPVSLFAEIAPFHLIPQTWIEHLLSGALLSSELVCDNICFSPTFQPGVGRWNSCRDNY